MIEKKIRIVDEEVIELNIIDSAIAIEIIDETRTLRVLCDLKL